MKTEELLERLAAIDDDTTAKRTPARLKSRIYSALVSRLTDTGPLLSLQAIKEAGTRLCVFEEVVTALPAGEQIGSRNPCRICHARVLGERLEWAPIFWPGCPYAKFHND
jgi:hypothetical protein